jgi:predicted RNase H-like HicB family nuclease
LRYQVQLKQSEEGYAIWCPILPGCWSQGDTETEAIENIKEAIQDYLETIEDLNKDAEVRYYETTPL